MRSIVAVTNELDDAEKAADELLIQIEDKGPLGKNTLGMFYCDVETDHENFIAALQEKLLFELVGCTSMATFDTENGAQTMAAVLVVLTADDAGFSAAVTGALTVENLRPEMETAYHKAASGLDGEEKLILLLPPFIDAVPIDDYADILSELSGDVPVFGGIPSSGAPGGKILIYAAGRSHSDRAAVVLLGGNVRPVFSVQNVISGYSGQKFTVTEADRNVIYTVDGIPFTDYLRSVGIAVDKLMSHDDLALYAFSSLKVNLSKNNYNDGIPVVRTIKTLNRLDGSGVLLGAIPKKSTISMVAMKRQDIQDSCKMAIKEILEKIAAGDGDYTYSTLLCVSCGGRYIVMADDKELEGDIITENLPQGVTFSGFYAFGEICPTAFRGGVALNRAHNKSIVMCAL